MSFKQGMWDTAAWHPVASDICTAALAIRKRESSCEAYHKKAMRLHPDKGGDPDDFKELQRAFEVMTGHLRRRTCEEDLGCVDIVIQS